MHADCQYSASNVFETFHKSLDGLESIGERYYQRRQAIMQANQQCFTKTYHHFHVPEETDPAIQQLRHLDTQMS